MGGISRPDAAVALYVGSRARPLEASRRALDRLPRLGLDLPRDQGLGRDDAAFLSAGSRFLLAGALLARDPRGDRPQHPRHAPRARLLRARSGSRCSTLGVGVVTLAETRIDSSIAAMIAGSVPLQVILLRTLARERVALATRLSVLAGLAGLALIVVPGGEGASSAVGLALMLGASVSWSLGSFFGHRLPLPRRRLRRDDVGDALRRRVPARARRGDRRARRRRPGRVQPRRPSPPGSTSRSSARSSASRAYAWLIRNAPISKVVTHQYVNPVVAIALGALFLDERLTVSSPTAPR